ncbi:MAG: T9SS type A sorting domain-containing protein [Candidatus Marinimicrobia bacterium]|nr:T9SS type A sorting domain-containing protein [FCB group bacterium]MBL7026417.1 T9SS type A sorting domain-containing protein [Candidatus Neomarinimicrobiota bacterium]
MTKRISSIIVLFIFALTGQGETWEFGGAFPDDSGWPQSYGHGIAVDGEGKIWYTSYYDSDSMAVEFGPDSIRPCRAIYVFNPDGSQAPFSPIKTITVDGVIDTLWQSNRGLRTDPNGNIVAGSWSVYYRINHLTGEGMDKLVPYPDNENPEDPWTGQSLTAPDFDQDGNMFTVPVIASIGAIKAYDEDWELIDEVVPAEMLQGYCRTISVSPDGGAVYFYNFVSDDGIMRYNSSDGSVYGDFTSSIDTLFPGLQVEATGWDPSGRLWVGNSAGPGYMNCAFYAIDPSTDTVVDSIIMPDSLVDLGLKPRGIDFGFDGQTAYITFFNSWESAAMYVYHNGSANTVKFSVNMSIQEALGRFQPALDQIGVSSTFNGGDVDTSIQMHETGTSGIYTATIDFSAFEAESVHEYKFVITKPNQQIWESRGARMFVYNGTGMIRPTVWFNDIQDLQQDDPWSIDINVSGGSLNDLNNIFGTQIQATVGYDVDVDLPEPPTPPADYLQLYFPHPEWGVPIGPNFTTDFRDAVELVNNIISWDFEVTTDMQQTSIELDFSNSLGVPMVLTFVLEDISNGIIHDLTETLYYEYNSESGGVNQFRVSIGESLADQLNRPFEPGWHLFSTPLVTAETSTDGLLGPFANQPYYVYEYEPGVGYAAAPEILQGEGYWLATMDSMRVQISGVADTTSFSRPLDLGWNLIGNPFSYAKPVATIRIEHAGEILDFDTAAANGWISNTLYGYDGIGYFTENSLRPWGGYWISALVEGLIFHLDFFEDTALRQVLADERSEEEWYLSIFAQQNGNADMISQLGVHPEASGGFDAQFDFPEPPPSPSPSYVSTYFVHSNWNEVLGSHYNRDIRSPVYMDGQESWQLSLHAAPGEVELSWAYDSEEIPDETHFFLIDIAHGVTINMNDQANYLFEHTGGESIFLIGAFRYVGVDGLALPEEYTLNQNYPNPFNPITTISYGLPERAEVSMEIYNMRGQLIATLVNEHQEAGLYQQIWNGLDGSGQPVSTGLYLTRLHSGPYTRVIKMIYLK